MNKGILFINYKLYPQAAGWRGVELSRKIAEVAAEFPHVQVAVAPQVLDIREVAHAVSMPVWAQHCDAVEAGRGTGYITPAGLREDGADGVFLDHSEKLFDSFEELQKAHKLCKKNNLATLVFAPDIGLLKKYLVLRADFYALEPPELIASKETSVAQAEQEAIAEAVGIVPEGKLIVGAGIKSREDVEIAFQLGACGVAVASDIVKANSPENELRDLLRGF